MNIAKFKKYFIVSCSFTLLFTHMIGSDFNVNEVFYSFDTQVQLEGLKFHPFHFFFSTLIRPFMPLHFVGILYFVKPDIYKEIDWPKAIFLFATIMLVFYYSIIYTCGLYFINVLRTDPNVFGENSVILNKLAITAKDFFKNSLDHILISIFEMIRGMAIYSIFKVLKVNKYYLYLGLAIIGFQLLSTISNYAAFFGFDTAFFMTIRKINLTHIVLQYWILIQLAWMSFQKYRREGI